MLVCCFMYYCVVAPCVSVLFDVFHLGKWGGGGGGEREWLSGQFGSAAAVCVSVPLMSVCHGACPLGGWGGGG